MAKNDVTRLIRIILAELLGREFFLDNATARHFYYKYLQSKFNSEYNHNELNGFKSTKELVKNINQKSLEDVTNNTENETHGVQISEIKLSTRVQFLVHLLTPRKDIDGVLGDLEETHKKNVKKFGIKKANNLLIKEFFYSIWPFVGAKITKAVKLIFTLGAISSILKFIAGRL